jgi:hypothetical protein
MKNIIGVLLIGLFLVVSTAGSQPSFAKLPGFDVNTLLNVMDDAINYCGNAVEILIASYQTLTESSKIVYFFKYYIPPDHQNPGTIMLLGCCFVGLWYGRKRMKK